MPFNQNTVPGFTTLRQSEESRVFFGGIEGITQLSQEQYLVAAAAVDAGNTPTTTLRGGNIMVKRDSDGLLVPYDNDAVQNGLVVGVLPRHTTMLGDAGVVANKWVNLWESGLLLDEELIGWDYEVLGKLVAMGFILKNKQLMQAALGNYRCVHGTANVTLTAANHGTRYYATDANTYTLPSIVRGLSFEFCSTTADITIVGATGSVVDGTDGSLEDQAVSPAGLVRVTACMFDLSPEEPKWVVQPLTGQTITYS